MYTVYFKQKCITSPTIILADRIIKEGGAHMEALQKMQGLFDH